MDITLTELNYCDSRLLPMLKANGFGIVEARNPHADAELLQARIWRDVDADGVPCGHEVGTVTRQLGFTGRYTLTLSDNFLSRERIHGLLTDILNLYVASEKKRVVA